MMTTREEEILERTKKTFEEYKSRYLIKRKLYKTENSGDESKIIKYKLRLPNGGTHFAVDVIFDGQCVFYHGDLGAFAFGNGIAVSQAYKFFSGSEIEPDYWSEKLLGDKNHIKTFDFDYFEETLEDYLKANAVPKENATYDDLEECLREDGKWDDYQALLEDADGNDEVYFSRLVGLFGNYRNCEDCAFYGLDGHTFTANYLYCCLVLQWLSNMEEEQELIGKTAKQVAE